MVAPDTARIYVQEKLSPTLAPALVALARARPEDPVTWLAQQLMAMKPAPPAVPVSPDDMDLPEWALTPPEPLSDAQASLVARLYHLCDAADGKVGDGIHLKRLAEYQMTMGPHSVKICSELEKMDVQQDGLVTFDEMTSYFTSASRFLSEDEFNLVVSGLIESIS